MGYNFESSNNSEVTEVPELPEKNDKVLETDEASEDYDACALTEVPKDDQEADEDTPEDEEDYDNFRKDPEESAITQPELEEDDSDFDACAKQNNAREEVGQNTNIQEVKNNQSGTEQNQLEKNRRAEETKAGQSEQIKENTEDPDEVGAEAGDEGTEKTESKTGGDEGTENTEPKTGDEGTEKTEPKTGNEGTEKTEPKTSDEGTENTEPKTGDEGTEKTEPKTGDEGTENTEPKTGDEGTENTEPKTGDEGAEDTPDTNDGKTGETDKPGENAEAEESPKDSDADAQEKYRYGNISKLEDLTPEQITEISKTPEGRELLRNLHAEMAERVSAENMGMTVNEYRDYKRMSSDYKERMKDVPEREPSQVELDAAAELERGRAMHETFHNISSEKRDKKTLRDLNNRLSGEIPKLEEQLGAVNEQLARSNNEINLMHSNALDLKEPEKYAQACAEQERLDTLARHLRTNIAMLDADMHDCAMAADKPYLHRCRQMEEPERRETLRQAREVLHDGVQKPEDVAEAYHLSEKIRYSVKPALDQQRRETESVMRLVENSQQQYMKEHGCTRSEAMNDAGSNFARNEEYLKNLRTELEKTNAQIIEADRLENNLRTNLPLKDSDCKVEIKNLDNGTLQVAFTWKSNNSEKTMGKNDHSAQSQFFFNGTERRETYTVGYDDNTLYGHSYSFRYRGIGYEREDMFSKGEEQLKTKLETDLLNGKLEGEYLTDIETGKMKASLDAALSAAEVKSVRTTIVDGKVAGRTTAEVSVGTAAAGIEYNEEDNGRKSLSMDASMSAAGAKGARTKVVDGKERNVLSAEVNFGTAEAEMKLDKMHGVYLDVSCPSPVSFNAGIGPLETDGSNPLAMPKSVPEGFNKLYEISETRAKLQDVAKKQWGDDINDETAEGRTVLEGQSPLTERIKKALEGDKATHADLQKLQKECDYKLLNLKTMLDETSRDRADKFEATVLLETGTPEHKQMLAEFNAATEKQEQLGKEIRQVEEQQVMLAKRSEELRAKDVVKKSAKWENPSDGGTEGRDVKADISDETREILTAFKQSNWEKLTLQEKMQVSERLRDSIANDLRIQDKPKLDYYNSADPSDFGGYSASANTIYINLYNMGNAAETADTIAHESRHCWQHERAEHPQTEQDYRFKENFENYVSPELFFDEYYAQPVERDAREYAEQVKNLIGQGESGQENTQVSHGGWQIVNETGNPRAPPEETYQSKAVSDLPKDFESKRKAEDIYFKELARSLNSPEAFKAHMSTIISSKKLTVQEIVDYQVKLFNAMPEGTKADLNIVDNPKAISTDPEIRNEGLEKGRLNIAFHDYHGLDESKPIYGIEEGQSLPEVFCRRGGPGGNNLTIPHADGSIPSKDELSIPYADNPEAIHIYRTDPEAYKEAIDILSDNSDVDTKIQGLNSIIERMNEKYGTRCSLMDESSREDLMDTIKFYRGFQGEPDDKGKINMNTLQCREGRNFTAKYGVCGTVAPMYVDDNPEKEKLYNGGAPQFNTPCPIEFFISLGIFREESKGNGGNT